MLLFKIEGDGLGDIINCCEANMRERQTKMKDFKFRCSCGPTGMRASGFSGGRAEAKRKGGGKGFEGGGRGFEGGGGKSSGSSGSAPRDGSIIDYSTETVVAVEVKSKNDNMSEFQELWMQLLKASSIRAEILKVTD